MERGKQGFTIIELVVVILVLGILAAVALPKFVDLRSEAYTATHRGTGGALAGAVNVVHAKWLAGGATATTVTLEDGTTIGVGPEGWPEDVAAGDGTITAAECLAMYNGLLQAGAPTADTAAGQDYLVAVGMDPNCLFTFQHDTATTRTLDYNANTGAVTIVP